MSAPLQHGLRGAFARSDAGDVSALTDGQRSRLVELRAELSTPDGVRAALAERAARMVLIAEWGEAWLKSKADTDGPIAAFTSPVLARLFTASAEARRALEALARVQSAEGGSGPDAAHILEGLKRDEQA